MPRFLVLADMITPFAFPVEAENEYEAIHKFNAAADDPAKCPPGFPIGPDEHSSVADVSVYSYEAIPAP